MKAMSGLLVLAMLLLAPAHVAAIPVPVPSDVAVTIAATPNSNLEPGQSIVLTLTVTNLGPQPINNLVLESSHIYDEIHLSTVSVDCDGMVLSVADGENTFYYFYNWYIAGLPGTPIFAVGETRICHIQLALTSQAPAAFPFSFGLASEYVDINPDNDIGVVVLRRIVASIPALSSAMLLLLAGLLAAVATVVHRRRRV